MKHIKLFENFNPDNISESTGTEFIMDWLPYDAYLEDPINQSIPSEVKSLKEAVDIISSPEVSEKGIYIGMEKTENGVSMIYCPDPENRQEPFVVKFFDNEFKLTGNPVHKESLTADLKSTSRLTNSPSIYNQVISNYGDERKVKTAGRLGDLGF